MDGTACVGGNVLALAKVFRRVVAVEIDAARCDRLRGNLALFPRPCCEIEVRCADVLELLPSLDGPGVQDLAPEPTEGEFAGVS